MHFTSAQTTERTELPAEEPSVTEGPVCVDEPNDDAIKDSTTDAEASTQAVSAQAPIEYYRLIENTFKDEEKTTDQQSTNANKTMEKFRKRLIHTVARHLRDKKPLEQLWPNMKGLTFDCKKLWSRMKALTLKKISRLLPAEDCTERIPKVARMTFTDWLMFDLVLVHEDIDLITPDDKYDEGRMPTVLKELFVLIQRFNLEESSKSVDPAAWAAATLFYNHNGRRLISPMLLQKRWYQMKRATRLKFINFWQVYKGHNSLLEKAREFAPDVLQQAISKRYPTIITQDFLDWKDLVEEQKIVMPDCFTDSIKTLPEPCDLEDPDLILLEQEIETINLDQDSECEENDDDEPEAPELTETAEVTSEHPNEEQAELSLHEDIPLDASLVRTEEDLGIKSEPIEYDVPLNDSIVMNPLTDIVAQQNLIEAEEGENNYADSRLDLDVETEDCRESDSAFRPSEDVGNGPEALDVAQTTDRASVQEWDVPAHVVTMGQIVGKIEEKPVKLEDSDIFPKPIPTDNIEFVDDGIELIEDDDEDDGANESKHFVSGIVATSVLDSSYTASDENPFVSTYKQEVEEIISDDEDQDTPVQAKFDLKLLMIPVVYTTRLDQMSVLKSYDMTATIDLTDILGDVISESVPVSAKAVNVKTEIGNFEGNEGDSFPSDVEKDTGGDLIRLSSSDGERDENTREKTRIRANSRLFLKPRTREYSTVQLCKNPDFNTKLKRLSAGFCTIARNRQFLKLCKPVTIDLHKSFEIHLTDGSLLLDGLNQVDTNKCCQDVQFNPIMPSAMPVQSLVDKEKVDINDLLTNSGPAGYEESPEDIDNTPMLYKKYEDGAKIDSKDIIKIKRLDNHMLAAEISPLRPKSKMNAKEVDELPHQTGSDINSSDNSNIRYHADQSLIDTNLLSSMNSGMSSWTSGNAETRNVYAFSKPEYSDCRDIYTPKDLNKKVQKKIVINPKPKKLPKPIAVPWSSYFKTVTPYMEFNLALDTLNKMLQVLGDTNFICKKGKFIEKKKNFKNKHEYPVGRRKNVNVTERGGTQKNVRRTKKRFCCWYSRYEEVGKYSNRKIRGHKCGEVCICCCKVSHEIKESKESSEPQIKSLDIHKEAKTAVENLQECSVPDNEQSPDCVSAEKNTVACIVLSDDDVDDKPKKPKFRVLSKSKSLGVQIESHKEFINLNTVLPDDRADDKPQEPEFRVFAKSKSPLRVQIESDEGFINLNTVLPDDRVNYKPKESEFRVFAKSKSPLRVQIESDKEFINLNTVLSDDDVDDNAKKPKFRVFTKSKSPIGVRIDSEKKFINLNAVLAENEAKRNRAEFEDDNISLERNLPDLIPISDASMPSPKIKDKIRVTSCGGGVNSERKSLLGPKNFALSVNYDGKLMQLQITPGDKNKRNKRVLLNKTNLETDNAENTVPQQSCDYAIDSPVLPSGVHLVLLPNQQVMPYVEHGCNLSEKELKNIQHIISYVQNQLEGQKNCEIKYPLHNNSIVNTDNSSLRELNVATSLENVNVVELNAEVPYCTDSEKGSENSLAQDKQIPPIITVDLDESNDSPFENSNSNDVLVENNDCVVVEKTSDENTKNLDVDEHLSKSDKEGNSDVVERAVENPLIFNTSCENTPNLENGIQNHEITPTPADSVNFPKEDHENQENAIGKIKIKQFASLSESFSEIKDVPERHNTGKNSILSDLMEMSGISSEDVLVSPEKCISTARRSEYEHSKYFQIKQVVNRDDTESITMLDSNDIPVKGQAVPVRLIKSVIIEDSTKKRDMFGELPKLVPITKTYLTEQTKKKSTHPYTVIHVDSDDETEILPTVNRAPGLQMRKYTISKKPVERQIVQMVVKKKTPSILRHSRSGGIRSKIVSEESNNIVGRKKIVRKRKDCLKEKAKVEAKIDLLDSDAPMEEEYLVDSFDSESDISQKNIRLDSKQKTSLPRRELASYDSSSNESISIGALGSGESSLFEKYLYITEESEAEQSDDSSPLVLCISNKRKRKIDPHHDSSLTAKPRNKKAKTRMKPLVDTTSYKKNEQIKNRRKNKKTDFSPLAVRERSEKRKSDLDDDFSQFVTFKKIKNKDNSEIDDSYSRSETFKVNTDNKSNVKDTDSSDDEPLANKVLRKESQNQNLKTNDIHTEVIVSDVKESIINTEHNVSEVEESGTNIEKNISDVQESNINIEQHTSEVKESTEKCSNSENL